MEERAGGSRRAAHCASVLGQCTFYRMGEAMLSKVQPGPTTDLPPARVEALAEHITFLSSSGLRAYAAGTACGAAIRGGR